MNRDRQATLFVDPADRPVERPPHGDWFLDEESQQVAVEGGDLGTGNHVEVVLVGEFERLVATRQPVVIRDGNHVQVGAVTDIVQHLSHRGGAIVERGVHMKVRFSQEVLLTLQRRLAPAVTGW